MGAQEQDRIPRIGCVINIWGPHSKCEPNMGLLRSFIFKNDHPSLTRRGPAHYNSPGSINKGQSKSEQGGSKIDSESKKMQRLPLTLSLRRRLFSLFLTSLPQSSSDSATVSSQSNQLVFFFFLVRLHFQTLKPFVYFVEIEIIIYITNNSFWLIFLSAIDREM